jgi:hypothetical protein
MNTQQLEEAIRENNIDERFVSLHGEVQDESYVLERELGQGWCVYYSERGERAGERFFLTEEDACQFIYDRLSRNPTTRKRI